MKNDPVPLYWASPKDMSGTIGLDTIVCQKVTFGPKAPYTWADYRAWERVFKIILPEL